MDPAPTTSAAVILAGGASLRFGTDKTRARFAGTTLLERVIRVVEPLVDEVVVIGPWAPGGCRQMLEPGDRIGPLAALAFGLRQVAASDVLVLGGDHPLLRVELLAELLARSGGSDAVVPRRAGRPEPLVASYRHSVSDLADRLVTEGERSLRALLAAITVTWMDESDWRRVDPDGRSFLDVDLPTDLIALRGRDDPRSGPQR